MRNKILTVNPNTLY